MSTTLFLDTFTDADGVLIATHTPDTAPAGDYATPDGVLLIQSNQAVGSPLGGADHSANYAFAAAFEPVYPYTVTMTARSYGTGSYNTGVILSGASESLKIFLVDPTNLSVITNNSESFNAVVSAAEHTVSVLVESGTFTVTIDGTPQTPVAFADTCRFFNTLTVTLEYPGSGTSYVDTVSVVDASTPPPSPGEGLPPILYPSTLPLFLAVPHDLNLLSAYAAVPRMSGHGRKRRMYAGNVPKLWSVALDLTNDQAALFFEWYENVLLAGQRQFSAQYANQGPGLRWWASQWVKESYKAQAIDGGGWMISGQLRLTGTGRTEGPPEQSLSVTIPVAVLGTAALAVEKPLAATVTVAVLPPAAVNHVGVGTSAGVATVIGRHSGIVVAQGTSAGVATVQGRPLSRGTSAGAATVSGVGRAVIGSVGTSAGAATVSGVGRSASRGTSAGVATVSGTSSSFMSSDVAMLGGNPLAELPLA